MRVRVIRVLPQVSFPRPETVAVRAAGPTVRPDRRTWRGRGTVRGAGATGGAGGRILAGSWRDPSEKLAGSFRDGSGTVRGRFEDDSRTIRGGRGGGNAVRPGRRPRRWGRAPALRHRPCHREGGVAGRTVWPGATPCKRPVGNALRGRVVGGGGGSMTGEARLTRVTKSDRGRNGVVRSGGRSRGGAGVDTLRLPPAEKAERGGGAGAPAFGRTT
jgi:hypothetical protein